MENSEAKSILLSPKAHRSVFLNTVNGKAIENTNYVNILETTCLKNHRYDSLSSKILSKFLNVMCKSIVS